MVNVMDLFRLDGKVALVTGGAKHLGLDMALSLAQAGADVALTSRNSADAAEAAKHIAEQTGRRTIGVALDVKSEAQVVSMVDTVLAHFGKIDILVNNAGNVISTPDNAPFEKRPLKEWQHVIDVNLTGAFLVSREVVAKAMKPARAGNVIHIASVAGIVGKDRRVYDGSGIGGSTIDYHASKAALINMARDMAVYLAPDGIRVNCISPGPFYRNQHEAFVKAYNQLIPLARFGTEGKDMNGAVIYLASEASAYVTGHNLVIDGGLTAW